MFTARCKGNWAGSKCCSYPAVIGNDLMASAYQKTGSISIFSKSLFIYLFNNIINIYFMDYS
jgi:hypothetical protein